MSEYLRNGDLESTYVKKNGQQSDIKSRKGKEMINRAKFRCEGSKFLLRRFERKRNAMLPWHRASVKVYSFLMSMKRLRLTWEDGLSPILPNGIVIHSPSPMIAAPAIDDIGLLQQCFLPTGNISNRIEWCLRLTYICVAGLFTSQAPFTASIPIMNSYQNLPFSEFLSQVEGMAKL